MAMALADLAPEWWPLSISATVLVAFVTLYAFAYQLSSRKIDPREPPVIAPAIPLVGHVLGMALLGGRYVKNLGIRNRNLPIFTLPVPGSRIYIVAEPSLAAAVQRASKALSFTPLVPEITQRVLGLDKPTVQITRRHLDPAPGEPRGFLADIQDMVYAWLGPGEYLAELSLAAATQMEREVGEFAAALSASGGEHRTDLLAWVRHLVTASTARYLYGPQNPMAADPSLEEAFWDFDHGLGALLAGVFPAVTARRAYAGRERLAAAMARYLEEGMHEAEGSAIVRERVRIALRHGWTLRAAAREELSFLFAGIVNATTTAFWVLLHVYADAELLAKVRGEVQAVLDTQTGKGKCGLSVAALRDRCPVLVATYRECLRLGSDTYSTRLVKEEMLLAGRYFLRKGAVVQIAGGVMHADTRIWGEDAGGFDYRRFLDGGGGGKREAEGEAETGKKKNPANHHYHPAAFRAFGGGKTLCPGRHFATNEILALVALVVLRFDVKGKGGGRIEVPPKNDGVLPVHVLEPVRPVEVVISEREEGGLGRGLEVEFGM
ncbi:hypothetical protein AAE478_008023 [Parahypoxylon ruwenzoriense]